jgi:GTP-binding protein Era
MQEYMMRFVNESLKDADLILYVIECGETICNEEIIERLQQLSIPILLVINKIDKVAEDIIATTKNHWQELLPKAETIEISALTGHHINLLLERIITLLPESPPFFPKDELTDRPLRFFISEIIREKILLLYKREIPYSVEVVIESFKETEDIVHIGAMLYCERDSQKGIIIGNKGVAIKQLGIESRKAIEDFIEKHVFLEISVKVLKDWRNQDLLMKRFGYQN